MGLIHLLQIRLQESSCYNAPEHDESDFGRAIAGSVSLEKGSVDSKMVVDGDTVIAGGSSRRTTDRGEESSKPFSIIRVLLIPNRNRPKAQRGYVR